MGTAKGLDRRIVMTSAARPIGRRSGTPFPGHAGPLAVAGIDDAIGSRSGRERPRSMHPDLLVQRIDLGPRARFLLGTVGFFRLLERSLRTPEVEIEIVEVALPSFSSPSRVDCHVELRRPRQTLSVSAGVSSMDHADPSQK